MFIWQKYLKVLGQVSSTVHSSISKYQVLLNFKVSSTSKYQAIEILHQVPSTKYKYFTWPKPWRRPCPCVHNTLRPSVFIQKKFTIHVLYVGLSHLIVSMYPYFEFTCQILSYANSPVSLLPLLPVYGVSNGLLFGISGYRWIEILISLNHYNISKSTYPSFIGKSNYRTCWCL